MGFHLNHVALYTTDLERSKEFYVKYFGGKANQLYENCRGFRSYFISFDSGAKLELMYRKDVVDVIVHKFEMTGYSHIAFAVGSREKVVELTKRLVEDGYPLYRESRETGDGYYESCVGDPDGNRIEITA